jgi:truncated hemoglobin YjbI
VLQREVGAFASRLGSERAVSTLRRIDGFFNARHGDREVAVLLPRISRLRRPKHLARLSEAFSGLALPYSRSGRHPVVLAAIMLYVRTRDEATRDSASSGLPPVMRGRPAYRQEQRVIARALQPEME